MAVSTQLVKPYMTIMAKGYAKSTRAKQAKPGSKQPTTQALTETVKLSAAIAPSESKTDTQVQTNVETSEPKKPRSSFMQEMVENSQSPMQKERLMVGPGGVILFDSSESQEEKIATEMTAKAASAKASDLPPSKVAKLDFPSSVKDEVAQIRNNVRTSALKDLSHLNFFSIDQESNSTIPERAMKDSVSIYTKDDGPFPKLPSENNSRAQNSKNSSWRGPIW